MADDIIQINYDKLTKVSRKKFFKFLENYISKFNTRISISNVLGDITVYSDTSKNFTTIGISKYVNFKSSFYIKKE